MFFKGRLYNVRLQGGEEQCPLPSLSMPPGRVRKNAPAPSEPLPVPSRMSARSRAVPPALRMPPPSIFPRFPVPKVRVSCPIASGTHFF